MYKLLGLIVIILAIFFVSAMMGFDSCNCGYGPEIRSSVKSIFQPE